MSNLSSKPRKIRLQFRIRTLAFAALLFAILLSSQEYFGRNVCDSELFPTVDLSKNELDLIEISFACEGLQNWERHGRKVFVPRSQRKVYLDAIATRVRTLGMLESGS